MPIIRKSRNLYRSFRSKPIGFVHLSIEGEIPQVREPQSFVEKKLFPQPKYTFLELWEDSKYLLKQSKVKGLIISLRNVDGMYATWQSIRDLIKLWKNYNKQVWVYSNSFSFISYYVACAADRIYLTQGGILSTIGIMTNISFFKEYFEEKGLEVQVAQVTPYKSAANTFAYKDMPPEQRENIEWMLDSIYDEIVDGIAQGRNKSKDEIRKLIDNSPIRDDIALEEKLIDGILTPLSMREILGDETGVKHLTEFDQALKRVPIRKKKKANIAIIPVIGTIVDGKSKKRNFPIPIPFFGDRQAGDITVAQEIRAIKKNKKIKGVILLSNSGGGSATSSEVMLQELADLGRKIPVIAYFHDVAGSGGYYIAMSSKYIIAQPLTITASIGVVNAKFVTDNFYKQHKINRVQVKRGKNANITNTIGSWDESQKEIVDKGIFRVYDVFKNHVSKCRDIPLDELETIAGGRVYMGKQAKENKLVDELGNLITAIDKIAELANIKDPVPTVFSDPKNFIVPNPIGDTNLITQIIDLIETVSGKAQLLPYLHLEFK
jgi:protease IV